VTIVLATLAALAFVRFKVNSTWFIATSAVAGMATHGAP
jgi:hypothetical protein